MLYIHPFYLIFQDLKVLILQQDFIQEPPIFRSASLMTDGIFQDGCNNFSQPTCSSYIDIDVLPVKIQGLHYLPLNLSKTAAIEEVMPPDFWGQDMKEASASSQFTWDAIFWNPAAILWGSTGHMESPRVGVQQTKCPSWNSLVNSLQQAPTCKWESLCDDSAPIHYLPANTWETLNQSCLAEPSQSLNFER